MITLRIERTRISMKRTDWIVTGGSDGALGTCTRWGETLKVSLPQSMNVVTVSIKAFVKEHSDCRPEESQA